MNCTNVRLIWHRELRDQLRDRRTIFTIAILPLVLYPMMGMTFLRVTQFLQEHPTRVLMLGTSGLPESPSLVADGRFADSICPAEEAKLLQLQTVPSEGMPQGDEAIRQFANEAIQDGRCETVLYVPANFSARLGAFRGLLLASTTDVNVSSQDLSDLVPAPQLFANIAEDKSRIAHDRVERVLQRWREELIRDLLRSSRLPEAAIEPFSVRTIDVSDEPFRRAAVWSKVLPFVVLIWALTGAFYPAIDLCAGEKERGTLETLLCSPAMRSEIVWGKLLTVTTFSAVTALLNLFSLGLTGVLLFGRLGTMAPSLQIGPPPVAAVLWLLLAVVPIAALFSAMALAIAAFARSSKEGQYYLMPLLLITLPLMILSLLPAVELELGSSFIPVTGVMLWLRALIEGEYTTAARFAAPVMGVTAACAWLAIRWAERQFENESVLFRESERFGVRVWMRHMMRDREDVPTITESLTCGLVILIITFFGGLYIQIPGDWLGMAQAVLATQLGLIAAPAIIMAVILTRRPARTLLLSPAPWMSLPLAVLLAVSLHPSTVLLAHQIQSMYPPSEEVLRAMEPLSRVIRHTPWWQLLPVFALTPAICEELAFRGFVLSGLRRLNSTAAAVIISSLFFGITHGMLQQSLSATVVGLVLGFVAVRTGSLIPCALYHFTHNGLSVMLSRAASGPSEVPAWLGWLIHPSPDPAIGFEYTTATVILTLAFSVLLLRWFHRLAVKKSTEEKPAKTVADAR